MTETPGFEDQKQLEQLAAALCDGEITAPQAARLERLVLESEEARRHFVRYMLMHGELAWDLAAGASVDRAADRRPARPPEEADSDRRGRLLTLRARRSVLAAAAALVVAASLGVALLAKRALTPPVAVAPETVARLTGIYNVIWQDGRDARSDSPALAAGETLALDEGLAEVTFDSGASVVVQGPCRFQVETNNRGRLESGSLRADVPRQAAGFSVHTPAATIVDRGTKIGVAVEPGGASAVHVFVGRVELVPEGRSASPSAGREVTAGEAYRVSPADDGEAEIREIALDQDRFAWQIPPSVAHLRQVVAADRRLIHHYTFEGSERDEICRDKRGQLDLAVVPMAGGTDGLDIYEAAPGFDATSNAVRPYRGHSSGNRVGVALQSKEVFSPPQSFTVELLLKREKNLGLRGKPITTAVATGGEGHGCGFFVAASDEGRLACRLGQDAPWTAAETALEVGDWYYVAFTFRVAAERTVVNGYLADLTGGQQVLTRFIAQETIEGVTPSGFLGIGKGFDRDAQSAYPWAGILDEVAIYDDALSQETLEGHLRAVVGPSGNEEAPQNPPR